MIVYRFLAGLVLAGAAVLAQAASPLLFTIAERHAARAPQDVLLRVELNPALFAAAAGSGLRLDLPGIGATDLVLGEVDTTGATRVRAARALDGSAGARFVMRAEGVSGELEVAGAHYRLGFANDSQWIVLAGRELDTVVAQRLPQVFRFLATPARAARRAGTGAAHAPAEVAYPAELDIVALSALEPDAQVQLNLPGADFRVVHESTRASDGGAVTFVGHLADWGPDYRVVLTYGPGGSSGVITTPSGEFTLGASDGQTYLIDSAASGLRSGDDGEQCAIGEQVAGDAAQAIAQAIANDGAAVAAGANAAVDATIIDVLVLYTPGMVSRYGSAAAVDTRIDFLLALANQAYRDSAMPIQVRRVGADLVSYSDTTTSSSALSALRAGSDPAFAGVAARRNELGADLVVLLRPFYMAAQGGGVCGVGYIGGYNGSPISHYAASAFSVVSDGVDVMRTGYYCQDVTLAHELGHNMGAMHDRANAGGGSGAYPYAFGYGRSGSFGTVMSYVQPRIAKFSNPRDLACGGSFACGVASTDVANAADNALALTNTRSGVAAFRPSTVGGTLSIAGVVSSGGVALANVSLAGAGATCTPSAANGAYSCTVPTGWSGTLTPSRAGYRFTPASRSYSALAASQAAQNFTAAPTSLTISGTVTAGAVALANVVVSGVGATCSASAANGAYTCTVPTGWSGTLTPSRAGYTFTPASRSYSGLAANAAAQNFVGSATVASTGMRIRGRITVDGIAARGVSVSAPGGTCTPTGAAGDYTCVVPRGWSGRVTPTPVARFTPSYYSFFYLTGDRTAINFRGTTSSAASRLRR